MLFNLFKRNTPPKEAPVQNNNLHQNNLSIITDDMKKAAILHYCSTKKGKPIEINGNYPKYMSIDYGIDTPWELQKQLLSDGLLVIDEKEYCHPSASGVQLLNKYEWLFTISKYHITREEYLAAEKQCQGKLNSNDIIWGILNKQLSENGLRLGYTRNTYLTMANFCKAENRFTEELSLLIFVLWYDLNGVNNSGGVSLDSSFMIRSIASSIAELKDYYNPTMLDKLNSMLPSSIISMESFSKILNAIFENKDYKILLPKETKLN